MAALMAPLSQTERKTLVRLLTKDSFPRRRDRTRRQFGRASRSGWRDPLIFFQFKPISSMMITRIILSIVGLAAIIGALVFVKTRQFAAMGAAQAAMVMPPTVVTATTVHEDTWEDSLAATGSLVAVQGVMVSAEVAGKITRIAFEAGATVAAGDLLVQLDTSTEEAQLASVDAAVTLAEVNLKRQRELRAQNTNAPSDLDAAEAQKQANHRCGCRPPAIAKINPCAVCRPVGTAAGQPRPESECRRGHHEPANAGSDFAEFFNPAAKPAPPQDRRCRAPHHRCGPG